MALGPTQPRSPLEYYLLAARALFWVICIGIFFFAAVQAWPLVFTTLNILTPFILGLMFAYVLHPVVEFLQRKLPLGRGAAILVVGLILVGVIVGFLAILLPLLFTQIRSVFDGIANYLNDGNLVKKVFRDLSEEDQQNIREMISDGLTRIRESFVEILKGNTSSLKPVATGSIQAAGHTLSAILATFGWFGSAVAATTITTIATAWYLVEMYKIPEVIRRVMPGGPNRERYWDILVKANKSVGGFLRGQLIACIGVGILTTILMLLVGPRKYALLIGFMAGAVNFIPYLGPTVGAAPSLLWALFASSYNGVDPGVPVEELLMTDRLIRCGLILGGFGLIQAIDGFVFQPFIVGPQAALHPLAVMLALIIGAQFGIGGMILAVPVASALKVVFVELYWNHTTDFLALAPSDGAPPTTDSPPPNEPPTNAAES